MEQKKPEFLILLKGDLIERSNKYKDFDSMLFHKLVVSVTLYGQILPLVVVKHEEKYKIISGNKLFAAMQQIGHQEFQCVVIEDKYNVADIVLNELQFKTNYIELGDRLLEMNIDEVKKMLPLTEEEVMKVKAISSYDWGKLIKKDNENQVSMFDLDEIPVAVKPVQVEVVEEVKKVEKVIVKPSQSKPLPLTVEERIRIMGQQLEESKPVSIDVEVISEPFEEEQIVEEAESIESIENIFEQPQTIEPPEKVIINPHVVFIDENSEFKVMNENEYELLENKPEVLFKDSMSECRLYIYNKSN